MPVMFTGLNFKIYVVVKTMEEPAFIDFAFCRK